MKLREIIKQYGLGQVVRPMTCDCIYQCNHEFDNNPFWIMEKEGLQLKVGYLPCGQMKGLSWPNRIARIEINSNKEFEIIGLSDAELICLMNDMIFGW